MLVQMILSLMLAAPSANVAVARQGSDKGQAAPVQLRGLSSSQADELIRILKDAQAKLRRRETVLFELLSGAPASYPMTKISPRKAFLAMPFGTARIIEAVPTDNQLWRPYKLVFMPGGPGQLIWDVEVILGPENKIERIEMVYKPPASF